MFLVINRAKVKTSIENLKFTVKSCKKFRIALFVNLPQSIIFLHYICVSNMNKRKKGEAVELQIQDIQSKIYEIRGRKVMLDFDLAEMYGVETRRLKEQVRRNIERFPDDFMFRLSSDEAKLLIDTGRSQNAIPLGYNIGSSELFAFTQEGAATLSGVLRSPIAIQANIVIMRAFNLTQTAA